MIKILCIFIVTLLPLMLKIFRIPRWTPVYVFCLFWWAQFILCYLMFSETEWSIISAVYILGCGICCLMGFRLICPISDKIVQDEEQTRLNYSLLNRDGAKRIIIVFVAFGFVYSGLSLVRYGFSLRSFLDVDSLLSMNNQMAVSRYSSTGNGGASIVNQLLLSFLYAAPMAGGAFFPFAETRGEKALCIATFFPELLILFSQNLKAGFIGCIIFWVAGYFVSNIRIHGKITFSRKTIRIIAITFVLIFAMLFFSMVLRTGKIDEWSIRVVKGKILNYAFGHVAAIDSWISDNFLKSPLTLGTQTFIGIARYIGLNKRIQGIYQDVYSGPDLSTNVFSYFRGIYEDFGFLGSFILFMFIGLIIGYTYGRLYQRGTGRTISEMVLVIQYAFVLYFVVSVFSYTSFIVSFFLFFIYSYFAHKSSTVLKLPHIKFVSIHQSRR